MMWMNILIEILWCLWLEWNVCMLLWDRITYKPLCWLWLLGSIRLISYLSLLFKDYLSSYFYTLFYMYVCMYVCIMYACIRVWDKVVWLLRARLAWSDSKQLELFCIWVFCMRTTLYSLSLLYVCMYVYIYYYGFLGKPSVDVQHTCSNGTTYLSNDIKHLKIDTEYFKTDLMRK